MSVSGGVRSSTLWINMITVPLVRSSTLWINMITCHCEVFYTVDKHDIGATVRSSTLWINMITVPL